MSFRAKVTSLILAIVLITAAAVEYVVYTFGADRLEGEIVHQLQGRVEQTLEMIDRTLFERIADIRVLASDPAIRKKPYDRIRINRRLTAYRNQYKFYASLSFFDNAGIRIADTDGLHIGEKPEWDTWLADLMMQPKSGFEPKINFKSNRQSAVMVFGEVVNDDNGNSLGAVVASIPVTRLHQITAMLEDIHSDILIDLVDNDGITLYSNYNRKSILRQRPASWAPIQARLAASRSSESQDQLIRIDGREYLYTFARELGYLNFKGNNWMLIAQLPEAVVLIPAEYLRQDLTAIFAVVLILSALAAWYISYGISQPLINLRLAVDKVAQGEFGVTSTVRSNGDIGHLVCAFNKMSLNLRDALVSRDYVQSLIGQMAEALIVTDQVGVIRTINPSASKLLGFGEKELIGKPVNELFASKHAQSGFENAVDPLSVGIETTWIAKSGQRLPVLVSCASLCNENGQLQGMIILAQDTSRLRQTQEQLRLAKESAEAANQAKSAFLARMSHELRTPLNGILGYAQILNKAGDLSERFKNAAQTIEQCGNHLLTLINDILDLSKIEAGKLEIQLEDFQFPQCMDTICEMIRIRAEKKGLFFHYDPQTTLPKGVKGDENRICQILLNLLGNAIKFTHEGGVYFRIHYKDDTVRFEVEDTGIGIPQQQLSKIFEPFYNIDQEIVEGTGLGLAITKELVDAMGGQLEIESTSGKGTLFRIDIELPEVAMTETESSQIPRQIIGYHGRRRKILLVDDKSVNRRMLADMLSPLGFKISEAGNGIEAINNVKIDRPDIILMDLVMPILNGLTTTNRIKSQPNADKIKILAVSASSYHYNQQQALAAGCDDFLAKPIQIDVLLEKLGQLLALQWRYHENDESFPDQKNQFLVMPNLACLNELRELVIIGDVQGLRDKASTLEQTDVSLKPFAAKLKSLAQDFELHKIRQFLESSISNEDSK